MGTPNLSQISHSDLLEVEAVARTLDFRSRKKIITIGLAYASQEVARVPTEPHDQKLDYIITEKELISFCPA